MFGGGGNSNLNVELDERLGSCGPTSDTSAALSDKKNVLNMASLYEMKKGRKVDVGGGRDSVYQNALEDFRMLVKKSDSGQKNVFIWELLNECDDSNLLYAASLVEDLRTERETESDAGIFMLPRFILLKILQYVDAKTLCKCMSVCREFLVLCNDSSLWRGLCDMPKTFRMGSKRSELEQRARFTNKNGSVRWKDAFRERYKLWNNWHNGRCVIRTFCGHNAGISCVQFDDQRIVSGSSDSTIRVWDINSLDLYPVGSMALTGHSDTVRCLQLNRSRLASGSNDRSIKVWDLSVSRTWASIACRRTMIGHSHSVRCLQMGDEYLISGSYDRTLKIWSVETGADVKTYIGHAGPVLCLQSDDRIVISGSSDCSIKCWDMRGDTCIMTVNQAHRDAVTCLRFDNERIISGSVDRTIKVWDLRTGHCSYTLDWMASEGHTGVVRCLQVDAWRIVSSADDKTIKVWDLNSTSRQCTLQSHKDGVTCVQFNDYKMVSGSYDKTVKLWDFTV